MAGILIPRRQIWTRQPQSVFGFNPAFPRPAFAFVASLGLYERAAQIRGTKASGDGFRATQQGIVYRVARATDGGLDFGVYQPITSDAFTIIVGATGQSTDGTSFLFSQRFGSSPYNSVAIGLNQANDGSNRAGGFAMLAVDSSGLAAGGNIRSAHSNSTALVDGSRHIWCGAKASASSFPILSLDGVDVAATTNGTATGSVLGNAQKSRIGNAADYGSANGGDGSLCAQNDIDVVLIFNSVLSAAMKLALTESPLAPYKVFQAPARRIFVPVGGAAFNLAAAAGVYAVTGQNANVIAGRKIVATAGSYGIAGQNAGLKRGGALPAGVGSYGIAGQNAAFAATRQVGTIAGSYSITGNAVALTALRNIAAVAGIYALSGSTARIFAVRQLSTVAGTYASAGQSASLAKGSQLGASAGSYAFAGASATLRNARALGLAPGSYAITGQGAMLVYGTAAKVLAAAPGLFSVSGQSAALAKTSKLTLGAGAYAVSGTLALLRISRRVSAAVGSYGITGSAASLSLRTAQAVLVASPGAFSLTGQSAAIKVTRLLASGVGSYAVAGQQSALKRMALVNANAGSYSLTGQQVTFAYYRRIAASSGSFLITGLSANLVRTVVVSAFVHGNRRVFEMSGRKRDVVIPK